jgi:hypothetical protein
MKKGEGYELKTTNYTETVEFRFTSVGEKGEIKKIIEFYPIQENQWNLGFGDLKDGDWVDSVVSNNNDFRKVLQTVANAIHIFLEMYPHQEIIIIPVDNRRKLLYNRMFQQKWDEIEPVFVVKARDLSSEDSLYEDYNPRKIFDYFVIKQKK